MECLKAPLILLLLNLKSTNACTVISMCCCSSCD